jgi:hypothetical protein
LLSKTLNHLIYYTAIGYIRIPRTSHLHKKQNTVVMSSQPSNQVKTASTSNDVNFSIKEIIAMKDPDAQEHIIQSMCNSLKDQDDKDRFLCNIYCLIQGHHAKEEEEFAQAMRSMHFPRESEDVRPEDEYWIDREPRDADTGSDGDSGDDRREYQYHDDDGHDSDPEQDMGLKQLVHARNPESL